MFSGLLSRYLNLDFFSTHHIINRLAYHQAFFLRKSKRFPQLSQIQEFSGIKGPDGLWVAGISPDSEHTYNPESFDGDALHQVEHYFDALVRYNRDNNETQSAKAAAYLSHYIVDALDPAHHIGYKKTFSGAKNWHDPYLTKDILTLRNLVNRHFLFEIFSAYYLWWKQKMYIQRHRFIFQPRSKERLLHMLRRRIVSVYRLRIYERFFQKRLNATAKTDIMRVMFPLMISSVASFWSTACRVSLKRRFRRRTFFFSH